MRDFKLTNKSLSSIFFDFGVFLYDERGVKTISINNINKLINSEKKNNISEFISEFWQ